MKKIISEQGGEQPAAQAKPVRPNITFGQTGVDNFGLTGIAFGQTENRYETRPRTFKPRNLEVDKWKKDKGKSWKRKVEFRPSFDYILNKYAKEAAISENRPRGKRQRSPPRKEDSVVQKGVVPQIPTPLTPIHPVVPNVPSTLNMVQAGGPFQMPWFPIG